MKGPRSRHKFRIERWWECPRCQRRVATSGQTVVQTCPCIIDEAGCPVAMRLIEEASLRPAPVVPSLSPTDPPLEVPIDPAALI